MELRAAVAAQRAENVAGETLAVYACEDWGVAGDVSHYEGEVGVSVVVLSDASVGGDVESSPLGGNRDG